MKLEKVKVYRADSLDLIFIHFDTTPVFKGYSAKQRKVYPRLELIGGRVNGFSGPVESRSVNGKYPWIPEHVVVECYYDAEKRKLL